MSIVLYGLSSELMRAASQLGVGEAYVVDEVTGIAYRFSPGLGPEDMLSSDSLTPILPSDKVVSEAETVLYAPKYTRIDDRNSRLSDISWHVDRLASSLAPGSRLVNMLPVGLGENSRITALLAAKSGSRVSYVYAPLDFEGSLGVLGLADEKTELPAWLSSTGKNRAGLESAERAHIESVLSRSIPLMIGVAAGYGAEGYLSDLAKGMLEVFLVGSTAETSSPLYNLYNFARKTFDTYLKRLVQALKNEIKASGMKISRARILVLWTYDRMSARGEEPWAYSRLRETLASSFVDVVFGEPTRLALEKRDVVLACTARDEEKLLAALRHPGKKILLRASLPEPERIEV